MTSEPKIKIRDIPPTAIRLKPELRHALMREAAINGVSLHAEIVGRLAASIAEATADNGQVTPSRGADAVLPDIERALLSMYRRLAPEKQLALVSLLK